MTPRLVNSLNYAIEGILHAARTQRHIRYHLFAAMLLLLSCFSLGINREEFIILAIVAMMVIVSEMFNSIIEEMVNIVSPRKNVHARIIKDMAAGAVLLAAAVALVVAYFLVSPYIRFYIKHGISIAKHTSPDIAFCTVLVVLIFVIVIKAYTGKGHPLRGGMPSGHAAIAFSLWMSVTYTAKLWYISLPLLIVATAVAASRVIMKIHYVHEVVAGAILGSSIALLLYSVFY